MNLKNDNISVREIFLQKIEKIKIIVSLYKQDIYQAIVDLYFIYDNYKKFIEIKNKEMAKYLKKEKFLNDLKQDLKSLRKKDKIIKINNVMLISENRRYLNYLFILLFVCIILNITINLLWKNYNSVYERINLLIRCHGNLSNDGYKIINYFILMILSNYTIEDINELEEYDQSKNETLFTKLYSDIEDLYEATKLMNKLSNYNLDNVESYYNYTCQTFYDFLFIDNAFLQHLPLTFKTLYVYSCQNAKIFESHNYIHIFAILFNYIQGGINEINDRSYNGLMKIMINGRFPKIISYDLFIYNYIFEILGAELQRKSYEQIRVIMVQNIYKNYIISYFISTIVILIVNFGYIMHINNNYNKIHEIKRVFKVCNKKE